MGEIASSNRFVAGCTRCLRAALGIRTTDDEDRQRRDPSVKLAGTLLAGSMAVASGSRRLRNALANIPITDDQGAAEAGLRRRLAMASPVVAAGLLAGAVNASPAQAEVGHAQASQSQEPGASAGRKIRQTPDVPVGAPVSTSSFSATPVATGQADDAPAPAASPGRKVRQPGWSGPLPVPVAPPSVPDSRSEAPDRDVEAPDPGPRDTTPAPHSPTFIEALAPAPRETSPEPAAPSLIEALDPRPQDSRPEPAAPSLIEALDPAPRAATPAPAAPTPVPSVVLSGHPAVLDHALKAMQAGWDDVPQPEDDDQPSEPEDEAMPADLAETPTSTESEESEESPESDEVDHEESSESDDDESAESDDDESDESDNGDDEVEGEGESAPVPAPAPASNEAPEMPETPDDALAPPAEDSGDEESDDGDDESDESDGESDECDDEGSDESVPTPVPASALASSEQIA